MAIEYHEVVDPRWPDRNAVCFHAPSGAVVDRVIRETILSKLYRLGLDLKASPDAVGVLLSSETMTADELVAHALPVIEKYFHALERLASAAA